MGWIIGCVAAYAALRAYYLVSDRVRERRALSDAKPLDVPGATVATSLTLRMHFLRPDLAFRDTFAAPKFEVERVAPVDTPDTFWGENIKRMKAEGVHTRRFRQRGDSAPYVSATLRDRVTDVTTFLIRPFMRSEVRAHVYLPPADS